MSTPHFKETLRNEIFQSWEVSRGEWPVNTKLFSITKVLSSQPLGGIGIVISPYRVYDIKLGGLNLVSELSGQYWNGAPSGLFFTAEEVVEYLLQQTPETFKPYNHEETDNVPPQPDGR